MSTAYKIPSIFTAIDKFTAPVAKMEKQMKAFTSYADRGFKKISQSADKMYNSLSGGRGDIALAGSIGLAGYAINKFINEASKVEDAEAYFTPILGSVEKASKLVGMLNKEAANTPFQFNTISDATSKLLPVMNGDLDKTVNTFRMLGDMAGGNIQKLDSITRGFSKSMLKGKVDMESLNMIMEAGVPIYPELAKVMGYSENQMEAFGKAISRGDVKSDKLLLTIEKMTSQGGMFFKGMETASKTFSGVTSTMWDNINQASASIGMAMLPTLKEYAKELIKVAGTVRDWVGENQELIKQKVEKYISNVAKAISWLIDNYEAILKTVKWYIGTLVALKAISIASTAITYGLSAATFAYNVVLGVMGALTGRAAIAIGANTVAMGAYKTALAIVTAAQWAWNAAMSVGMWPLTLIIGSIGTLIYLAVRFYKYWGMVTDAFKNGGILAAIKAIGFILLDSVLMPIQKLLLLVSKIPGMDFARGWAKDIHDFRFEIQPVNPVKERSEMYSEQRQNVSIDINDKTGRADVKSDKDYVPVRTTSTLNVI